jgi:MYXO-CTERM domain-containing protein
MTRCLHAFALCSSAVLCIPGAANADMAETIIARGITKVAGTKNVNGGSAEATSQWSNPDREFGEVLTGSANVFTTHAAVAPTVGATSNYGSVSCGAIGTAEASDVIIRRRDGGGAGSPVLATAYIMPVILFNIDADVHSSQNVFNTVQLQWSASVVSTSGSTYSVSGRTTYNLNGASGSPLNSPVALNFEARVGEAFSVSIYGYLSCMASGFQVGRMGHADVGATSVIQLDSSSETNFVGNRTAFVLPEGYTADSEAFGIVDNMMAPVPSPAGVAVIAAGGLAARRRRR